MPQLKINNTNIEKIKLPKEGQKFYWDIELRGFGIRATSGGLVFVVQQKIDGKAIRKVIGACNESAPAKARIDAAEELNKLRKGININEVKKENKSKQVTFKEAYEAFKASKKLRPRTIQTYDSDIRLYLSDWLDKPLSGITRDMIQARHKELSDVPGVRGDRKARANGAMHMLRKIFNFAAVKYRDSEDRSLFPENPVKVLTQFDAWNEIPHRQDVIHAEDLAAWYQAVIKLQNTTVRDWLLLLLFTGLRRSEAMKLKWANVDLKKSKTLTIPAADAKTKKEHCLPLADFLVELLKARQQKIQLTSSYVFPGDNGKYMVEPKRKIAEVIKNSGIDFSPHTLRRTFETSAENLDLPYYALKRLLNHSLSWDITSRYIVTQTERLRQPMQIIADYFKDKCGISPVESEQAHGR